jgi:hypothetical protein
MGAVQLGGMLLSTLFTLILVPVMLSLWIDVGTALSSRLRRKDTRRRQEDEVLEPVRANLDSDRFTK